MLTLETMTGRRRPFFQQYDINEETYRRRCRTVKPLENDTLVELVIRVRDLAEKWMKDCPNRQDVMDALVKAGAVCGSATRGSKGLGEGKEA